MEGGERLGLEVASLRRPLHQTRRERVTFQTHLLPVHILLDVRTPAQDMKQAFDWAAPAPSAGPAQGAGDGRESARGPATKAENGASTWRTPTVRRVLIHYSAL